MRTNHLGQLQIDLNGSPPTPKLGPNPCKRPFLLAKATARWEPLPPPWTRPSPQGGTTLDQPQVTYCTPGRLSG
eukprot:5176254-Amphidinium_carterae.1